MEKGEGSKDIKKSNPKLSSKELEDIKKKLLEANRIYTKCIRDNFMRAYLGGENVNIEEICVMEYQTMIKYDRMLYPDTLIPDRSNTDFYNVDINALPKHTNNKS